MRLWALVKRHRLVSFTLIGAVVLATFLVFRGDSGEEDFAQVEITRGDIQSTVSATGTLSALVTVDVGSQLSGLITQLYADFNDEVEAGQVIARIDPVPFETNVAQAKAELAIAEASVKEADAAFMEAKATLTEAVAARVRASDLRKRGNVSQAQLDAAIATADQATARVASSEARILTAKAQVDQRKAALKRAEVDLGHTFIRSPVNGTIIERDVSIGQTVAASLQTPRLFSIAQDLSEMQVEVNVDEADIGQLHSDQTVRFTVDAYPDETFDGAIMQIRKAPEIEQNVVTYKVIVSAANDNEFLLPGMTANVNIILATKNDVLRIPNRALRFRPPETSELRRGQPEGNGVGGSLELGATDTLAATSPLGRAARAWRLAKDDEFEPIPLSIGITDGTYTEILDGALREGDKVLVGSNRGPNRVSPGRRPMR